MKNLIKLLLFLPAAALAEIDTKELSKYLPSNPYVIDAGAHNGRTSLELSELWPNGMIYSFEPVPALFNQLQEKTKQCSNIKRYQLALGHEIGSATFYVSRGLGDGSSSLLEPKDHLVHFPDVKFTHSITVNVTTMDAWAQSEGVDHIDLLWLDMQGAEYAAMKASPNIMSTVKAVYSEFSVVELYKNCPLYPEYKAWLESLGFKEVYYELIHDTFGDALFVRDAAE